MINLKVEDDPSARKRGETDMNIFSIIGIIVVVLFIAGYFGLK
jgi:LPXTG-motif cell wall-anchored protein